MLSRLYQNDHDLVRMQGMLMESRSQTNDWHTWHVGELNFAFFMVTCHLDACEHIRLWHAEDGRLAGFALFGEDPSFDCHVLPEFEWSGIEQEALVWMETRLVELRRQDAHKWGNPIVSGARQDDPRRIAFLEQHGFHYSGEFAEVNMLRSLLESIPGAVLPTGCHVRAVAEDGSDIPMRAEIHRAVWQPWTVGFVSDEDYARFMQMPGYDRDLDLVTVTPEGVIAAFVNGWLDPINRIGDLGPVGAHPAYRQQGLTRAVLLEGLRRMQARGMERACVSTGVSNTPARRLYESIGFRVVNRYLDYVKTG